MKSPLKPLVTGTPIGPASSASDNRLAPLSALQDSRQLLRARYVMSEADVVIDVAGQLKLDDDVLDLIQADASALVAQLRSHSKPTMMESFLSEYGLSTREGVGLMCLAEALLRVPDATTIDELIADKLESSDWAAHLGQSSSPLVNASTWALLLTGRLLDDSVQPTRSLSALLKRVGEPVVRTAVGQAMKLLGKQFVLGQNIEAAVREARSMENNGYTYSYDMLGEAAHTFDDAERYTQAYSHAIQQLSGSKGASVRDKPGISVKLSALHPRYEYSQHSRVMSELTPRVTALARQAAQVGVGFNIDAEEADRLDLSLDIIEALFADPDTSDWQGLGVVVQAYSRRALPTIQWLLAAAQQYDRKIMVRLVKGAYWDSEIKQAQELGLASFPVFTRKVNTDVSYLSAAQLLLENRHFIYPQFATHNAHSVCAIRHMAGADLDSYEFQRLHGMGESLHEQVHQTHGTRCRIYAPVGAHSDLLAYLVRRLLENGANSSFVNQIVDHRLSPDEVAQCPVRALRNSGSVVHTGIAHPADLYLPQRCNSKGYRLNDPASIQALLDARSEFRDIHWHAGPLIDGVTASLPQQAQHSPNDNTDVVGYVQQCSEGELSIALKNAVDYKTHWHALPMEERALALQVAADSFESHMAEFCALLCREAGKTINDAISEVREAVDFLRFYAANGLEQSALEQSANAPGHGLVVCISPWNFPLAIFTGQVAGALVAGNVVLAKPAEQTPLIAARAVDLMHAAGIPTLALQFVPGTGATIGRALTSDPRVDAVCFTGSTNTSRLIEQALASRKTADLSNGASPNPLFMAETGGLNAMIIDSSALTEQVVRDTVMSAFQSAGQRCSALRILYVQKEAEERVLTMLQGAMDTLSVGSPWNISTDVGPVIDQQACDNIRRYIDKRKGEGSLIHELDLNSTFILGDRQQSQLWIAPSLIRVNGIADMQREIFGPVLHFASYEAKDLSQVVQDINASGYGLTFGLHTRIDDRVQQVVESIKAGNIYVNRNQIGAVVGTQPFGGEGLSGTGPKAGGPWYVARLMNCPPPPRTLENSLVLAGPTGESNHWQARPRDVVILINDQSNGAQEFSSLLMGLGCKTVIISEAQAATELLKHVFNVDADIVACLSTAPDTLLGYRKQLAVSNEKLVPLVCGHHDSSRFLLERHVCIDTTAAGGNASLLGSVDQSE